MNESNFLMAKEARKIATEAPHKNLMLAILETIKQYSKNGYYSIEWNRTITEMAIQELRNLGYKVTLSAPKEYGYKTGYYLIEW